MSVIGRMCTMLKGLKDQSHGWVFQHNELKTVLSLSSQI